MGWRELYVGEVVFRSTQPPTILALLPSISLNSFPHHLISLIATIVPAIYG
eukprot:gnl/Chilomastix_caulleri/1156.p3 GENE.gnl/Chilomastix_caulleri/1156~~gnl/Chilomastix_caulleri/1156.p3  ORF type:complete len:51 (+),score=9.33 gnl/Chilomastix_caulleri/1156:51-203(+)